MYEIQYPWANERMTSRLSFDVPIDKIIVRWFLLIMVISKTLYMEQYSSSDVRVDSFGLFNIRNFFSFLG